MRRLKSLTRRQIVSAGGACLLCAAVAAAALTGNVGLALTLLAVFFTILFAGLLLLARRLSGLQRIQRRQQSDARTVLDLTQRRLLSALEELLLHSGDRHREVAERTAAQTREIEAIVQLFHHVTPRAPMPPSGGATTLLEALHVIRTRRPERVLAVGTGDATVWLAYAVAAAGGRLVALDDDVARGERALATHQLGEVAEVRATADDVRDVELLVIGGAADLTGAELRPLVDRLADDATVFLRGVSDAVGRWLETTEGLTREGEAQLRRRVSNRSSA